MYCNRKYTPEPKQHGYPDSLRQRAIEMYVDGANLRRIARHLKVAPQTVAYWVTNVAKALPNALMPEEVQEAKMDELFTFIGDKKIGITLAGTKPLKARQTRTRWKPIMRNCVTTWRVSRATHVALRSVLMRWNALCDCLCTVSTAGNCISNVFQTTLHT